MLKLSNKFNVLGSASQSKGNGDEKIMSKHDKAKSMDRDFWQINMILACWNLRGLALLSRAKLEQLLKSFI